MDGDENTATVKARGYDDPAQDDLLDRRPLARAVADVVSATPPEFGVRIGLFGEWGSGKTSVLGFIREILEDRGHTVVGFSPWGIADAAELWIRFAQRLLEQFEEKGKRPGTFFSRLLIKHHDWISTGTRIVKEAAGKASPVGGVAPAIDAVKRLLATTQQRVQEMATGNERIVVMVDDVDRADPKLVPPILFALRELFDVQRFSWILAIDPVVVRAALAEYHPGFGLGRDFLEKIVDFPFRLASPAPAHRVELLERELPDSGVPLDDTGLTEIAAWLPDNPRELRSIVRHFRSIARTLKRLGPEGFDQRLLVLLVVIHAAAPQLLTRLLDSPRVLKKLTGLKFFSGDEAKAALATATKQIRPLVSASGLRAHDRKRLRALLLRLGDGGYWTSESVIETGRLLHTAPIMTAREALDGVARAQDASTLATWLKNFGQSEDRSEQGVRRALFGQLLGLHSRYMDKAVEALAQEDTEAAVRSLNDVIRALTLLLFDLRAAVDIGPAGLGEMWRSLGQWAHFSSSDEYIPARAAERECLIRFAGLPELDPLEALDRVRSRSVPRGPGGPAGRALWQLEQDLLEALESRATEAFIKLLDKENTVSFFHRWKWTGRYLLRPRSRLWTSEVRPQLKEMLERAKSTARADNAVDMLRAVIEMPEDERRNVISDADLVKLLWAAATALAPNVRRFTTFEALKKQVEAAAGLPLDEPIWWQAKMAQQRAVAQADRPTSSSAEDMTTPPDTNP